MRFVYRYVRGLTEGAISNDQPDSQNRLHDGKRSTESGAGNHDLKCAFGVIDRSQLLTTSKTPSLTRVRW